MDFTKGFPDELLLTLFRKINIYTACMLKLVNKRLYQVSRDEELSNMFRQNKIDTKPFHGGYIRDGDLYMWGFNHSGRLMNNYESISKNLNVLGKKIKKVSTGHTCTIVLTEEKEVYIWGVNPCFSHIETRGPRLFDSNKFVQIKLAENQSIAAISEDGVFHFWDIYPFSLSGMKIQLPEDRISRTFFTPYIVGFVTEKGQIYLANYGIHYPKPKNYLDIFYKVDWSDRLPFRIKDVIWWKNERCAIVLSQGNSLYEVPIDYDYNVKDEIQHIQQFVKKAMLPPSSMEEILYLLTYDGRIIKYNMQTKRKRMLVYGKVPVDFSVIKTDKNDDRIDYIDEAGIIHQYLITTS